ncbi:alpha/beta hydrolase [Brevibacillus massiliensis]|uniref:alpha/beta hydrolase n=1 Tax=Brevibacillus massiliensis TaxID=1118054 RepID=UPI000370C8BB|nr:alpha/beta hydrolase-fold protein [Brevibacillus massiliensis]
MIQEVTLKSKYLGSAERILVYTPNRYSPLYSYPVLYVQDGADYLSLGRLATLLEQMAADKQAEDVIAVFLPVDPAERGRRYHPGGSAHAAYKRFLAEEVASYVDRHYATTPLGGARTLLGDSLGGVVSLFTALSYPHTFSRVACQSGAFDDKLCRMADLSGRLDQLTVYLEVGDAESAVKTAHGTLDLLSGNRMMGDVLQKKGVTLTLETFAGDHTWGSWQANLPRIIRYFFGHPLQCAHSS